MRLLYSSLRFEERVFTPILLVLGVRLKALLSRSGWHFYADGSFRSVTKIK